MKTIEGVIWSAIDAHDPIDPAFQMSESEAEFVVRASLQTLRDISPAGVALLQERFDTTGNAKIAFQALIDAIYAKEV